jgi:hypothetical protein
MISFGLWYTETSIKNILDLVDINNTLLINDAFQNKKLIYNPYYDKFGYINIYFSNNKYYVEFVTNRWFLNCTKEHINKINQLMFRELHSPIIFANIHSSLPYNRNNSINKLIYNNYIANIIKRLNLFPNEIIYMILSFI